MATTIAKGIRKEFNQVFTVYQSILEFSLEKMWLEIVIKHNKMDVDDMLDSINVHLIDVCEDYLKGHKLPLDKYQLALIIMDLYTKTISELDAPFKVTVKESKHLVQEYLEKNKSKREALERIKNENEALDKEILTNQQKQREKKVVLVEKPEMPAEIPEVGPMGSKPPSPKPKKKATRNVDALAVDDFRLPI